jgi:hypothetical protein
VTLKDIFLNAVGGISCRFILFTLTSLIGLVSLIVVRFTRSRDSVVIYCYIPE